MAWAAVGGAAVSVIGGALSASSAKKEAKKQRRAQEALNARAAKAFTPVGVNAPGGGGVSFGPGTAVSQVAGGVDFNQLAQLGAGAVGGQTNINPNSTAALGDGNFQGPGAGPGGLPANHPFAGQDLGNVNLNLGDLDPARAGLAQLATQNIGQAGLAQNAAQDPGLQALFAQFQGAGQNVGFQQNQTLNSLLGGTGQAFGGAQQQLFNQQANPFQQGLQNALFGGAADAFGALPGTQEQSRQQTLDLLRQQAQPFEDRAFSNLQERQFATGQSGTTGGGLQTEAFARGLGQADLQRQLAAGQEGRNAQTAQLGLAAGQLGAGSGLAGLQDQLLSSAQGRFGGLAQLANQLSTTQTGLQQQNFGNIGALLQSAFLPQALQQQLQAGFLSNANTGLGGVSALGQDARANANLGLNAAQAQSNARLGGVTASSVPQQDLSTSTAFAQLAQAAGGSIPGAISALGQRFGSAPGAGGSAQQEATAQGLTGFSLERGLTP